MRCLSKHCLTAWTREICLGPRGCLWDIGGKDRGSLDLEKRQHPRCCVLWGNIFCEGLSRVYNLNMCWRETLMFSGLCLESKDTGACSWAACLAPCTIKVEKFTSNSSLPGSHVSQSTHAFASLLTWERTIGGNVRWWLSMSKAAWMKLTNTAWGWKMEGEVPRTSVVVITEPAQL